MAETPLLIHGTLARGQGIIFLGCITCNRLDESSLANRFGDYSSQFSDVSACNPRASDPPVVTTVDGDFVG